MKSPVKNIELFLMMLKDSKKLNFNDEFKNHLIKAINNHLKSTIEEKLSFETDKIDIEKELITTLCSFESANIREKISEFMLKYFRGMEPKANQYSYYFKIHRFLFEAGGQKKDFKVVKFYMDFFNSFIVNRKKKLIDIKLLCKIFDTHVAMLAENKEKLEFEIIDEILAFYSVYHNEPSDSETELFLKFNEVIGQLLFVIGVSHQNYFKARTPQYFNAYILFMERIYFYKADSNDTFTSQEISKLLRLTLQLEK
jgi:hypothetical protein